MEGIAIAKSFGYHHHYDYVEDIDEDGFDFDDTVNDHDDPGVCVCERSG